VSVRITPILTSDNVEFSGDDVEFRRDEEFNFRRTEGFELRNTSDGNKILEIWGMKLV